MAHPASQAVAPFSGSQSLNVSGKALVLRADGRLDDLAAWTPEVANALAEKEGFKLLPQHWKVINAMRGYYAAYNVSPVKKLLKRALKEAGAAALTSDAALDELFPGGVLVQGSRIAGVPVPMLDAERERSNGGCTRAKAADVAHFVDTFEFKGLKLAVSCTGNLLEPHRWNEELAHFMAAKEGITLNAEHWEVLNFLRSFYFEFGITPMVKILMSHMAEELGAEHASREHLYRLFPLGPSRQGSRIAGLPEPQGCIDG